MRNRKSWPKAGQTPVEVIQSVCRLCRSEFKPIVEGQKFCSGTCARAVKDIDELGRVYAVLDRMLFKAYEDLNG